MPDRKEKQQEPERELENPEPKSNNERPGRDKLFETLDIAQTNIVGETEMG